MKRSINYRKIFQIGAIATLVIVLIYVVAGLKSKKKDEFASELIVDGEGMIHVTFDKKGREAIKIRCSQSERGEKDELVLKNIEGLIYKKGRMNKDIKVFGDRGIVSNSNQNFFIEQNARIASDDFDLKSPSFLLKDQAVLTSDKKVSYKTKSMSGTAHKGLEYFLKLNVLRFFKARGHYKRNGRDFSYKTDSLWIMEKDNLVVFEKKVVINEKGTILRSDWLSAKFTEGFKKIAESTAQKNCYFFFEDPEKNESREIRSSNINNLYNEEGKLHQVKVQQNAEILLKKEERQTIIASDLVELNFDTETGNVTTIEIPLPGQVENSGGNNFRISADAMKAVYNEKGEIAYCDGHGNVRFNIDDYTGISESINYDIAKNNINLTGDQSQVISGNNTFNSTKFRINSKQKVLASDDGVKSSILLDKKNVLFKAAPIFINAKQFRIFEKEKRFLYSLQVNMVQDDIKLSTQKLEITNDNNISASGPTSLSFKAEGKEMTLRGGVFVFDAVNRAIYIRSNAMIKSDENILKAQRFTIRFSSENTIDKIEGTDEVSFLKEELTGTAGKVLWLFKEDSLVLKSLPQIVKRNGGRTIGKILKIDLKDNKISVLSSETERTETIIR